MKKLTHEEVQKRISEKHSNLQMIEPFVNTRTKIVVKCSKCENIQRVNFKNLLERDFQCQGCETRLGDEQSYRLAMRKLHPDIRVIGEYRGNKVGVECECKVCGMRWSPSPTGSISGKQGCPKCSGKLKYSLESYREAMKSLHPDINVLSTVYINNKTPMQLECKHCGKVFKHKPCDSLNKEYGCPRCRISKGEKKIEQWLISKGINYEREYSFKGLIGQGGKPLRFDFYIRELNMVVEFDGNQHMYYSEVFHKNYDNFEKQQEHDRRKNSYCENNGIHLLRINYPQLGSIVEILEEKIGLLFR